MSKPPTETIQDMKRLISEQPATARVSAWAKRKLQKARTEQLKQECAPMMKLQSERRV